MSLPLIIWLSDELSQPWTWFHGSQTGTAVNDADKASLGALHSTPVQIVLAGQSIRQLQLELPPMKEGEKITAARFAIENDIGSPLKTQHVVIGGTDNQIISIISHDKMKDVLAHLSRADIAPDGLFADFDSLNADRPLLFSDRIIYPGPKGYTLDREWADNADRPEDRLLQVQKFFNFDTATNLLTGDYSKTKTLPFSGGNLARIAALFLAALTAWLGLEWSQTSALNQQADLLRTETANLYKSATGRPAPTNPALEVTRAVKAGGQSQNSFLDLSRLLFTSVAKTDGIMIETLQYDSQKNQLSLRLIYPQFESAGALENAVKNGGGIFRSGGVREQRGRLIGDATLEAAP